MTHDDAQPNVSLSENFNFSTPDTKLRGVNLGNWLLLEKWMSPGLYPSAMEKDEYTLCAALGNQAQKVMREHRQTWITEADFAWLANWGINAIRLPFGYWILEADGPYVASIDLLDQAVDWCEKYGMKLLLDLHGLPGSQGPEHHTGRGSHFAWPKDQQCYAHSLDIIEQLAQRYAGRSCVAAFSVVNEPHESIDAGVLKAFYEQSIERVRKHMPAEQVAAVIAAYPENLMNIYHGCLPTIANVWTDVHLYMSFVGWPNRDPFTYLEAATRRAKQITEWNTTGPVIVGEWSLSWPKELQDQLDLLPSPVVDQMMRSYANIQLAAYEKAAGWFFWSYKVLNRPQWSFRDAVEQGWLPEHYA